MVKYKFDVTLISLSLLVPSQTEPHHRCARPRCHDGTQGGFPAWVGGSGGAAPWVSHVGSAAAAAVHHGDVQRRYEGLQLTTTQHVGPMPAMVRTVT